MPKMAQISIPIELRDAIKAAKEDQTYEDYLTGLLNPEMTEEAMPILEDGGPSGINTGRIYCEPSVVKEFLARGKEAGLNTHEYLHLLMNPVQAEEDDLESPLGWISELDAVETVVRVLEDAELIEDCRRQVSPAYTLRKAREVLGLLAADPLEAFMPVPHDDQGNRLLDDQGDLIEHPDDWKKLVDDQGNEHPAPQVARPHDPDYHSEVTAHRRPGMGAPRGPVEDASLATPWDEPSLQPSPQPALTEQGTVGGGHQGDSEDWTEVDDDGGEP